MFPAQQDIKNKLSEITYCALKWAVLLPSSSIFILGLHQSSFA